MELISVIIPVYRVEKYLDECIESAVNQTYKNIDIILVDDGSPDRCPEICDAWAGKDHRIRVIHKENGGLSDARNAGMAASRGAFIAFVDSDDILEPEYIEYLYQALCETGADVSECAYERFTGSPEAVNTPESMCIPVIKTREELLHHFSNCLKPVNHQVWDKLYRRELIEDIPFLYGRQAQDVLFSCQVFCKCNKAAYIDNTLYHYRLHPESASGRFIRQRLDALETYWQSLQILGESYPRYVRDLKNYYLSLCFGAYEWILEKAPEDKRAELMKTVNAYRHRIRYTKEEWTACTFSEKMRYICSMPALIRLSVRLRNSLGRPVSFRDR